MEEGKFPVHHRYKYEWTDDGIVRATTIKATAMATGSVWEMRVRPRDGGGSDVHVHMAVGLKGPVGTMGKLVIRFSGGGAETFRKFFMKTLAVLEAESGHEQAETSPLPPSEVQT